MCCITAPVRFSYRDRCLSYLISGSFEGSLPSLSELNLLYPAKPLPFLKNPSKLPELLVLTMLYKLFLWKLLWGKGQGVLCKHLNKSLKTGSLSFLWKLLPETWSQKHPNTLCSILISWCYNDRWHIMIHMLSPWASKCIGANSDPTADHNCMLFFTAWGIGEDPSGRFNTQLTWEGIEKSNHAALPDL